MQGIQKTKTILEKNKVGGFTLSDFKTTQSDSIQDSMVLA